MPKLSALITLFVVALVSGDALAESLAEGPGGSPDAVPLQLYTNTWDGYLVDLPSLPPPVLLKEVGLIRKGLLAKQDKLESRVEKSRVNVADVLIAIVVPGGSAYLAGKVLWKAQAKQSLGHVNTDLGHLNEDLLAFQGLSRVYVIALAQGQ